MSKLSSHESQSYDPEPLTIAFTILGAVAPIGVLVAERAFKKIDDSKERKETVRNHLYDAYRALNNADRVLKEFASYVDQQGYLARPFRLGQAPLQGDGKLVSSVKVLYKDSWEAGRDLNDAIIALSKLLDTQDFELCFSFSEDLNRHLRRTFQAQYYKDYVVRMSKFIAQARRLIQSLGERYDFRPAENYLR